MTLLSTAAISVAVDVRRGGKLTSLVDRRSGREWLLPPAEPCGDPAGYGASFVGEELSGWDEMAPTIVACSISTASGPVRVPDHGEIWSVPWETVEEGPTRLSARVEGRAFPYVLERTIDVVGEDRLRLEYRLEHRGGPPFPVLWAAHPQFTWRPGGRIELPPAVERVLDVTGPAVPEEVAWDTGQASLLDHVASGSGHKVWTLPGAEPSWARFRDPDGGSVTLRFDPSQVPYVGVWWDATAHARRPVVAIEPSTGFYDDLAAAAARRRTPWLSAGERTRWVLEIELTPPMQETAGHR